MFEDAYLVPHHVLLEGKKKDLHTSPSGGFWTHLSPGHPLCPNVVCLIGYNAAGFAS